MLLAFRKVVVSELINNMAPKTDLRNADLALRAIKGQSMLGKALEDQAEVPEVVLVIVTIGRGIVEV